MAEQMRPASNDQAPDPSFNYERAHPERESQGKMDKPNPPPLERGNTTEDAVANRQDPSNQINSDPGAHGRTHAEERGKMQSDLPVPGSVAASQPDHSMNEEEPAGWDEAPQGAVPAEFKRHPRIGGKGGTPDEGETTRQG